MKYFGGTARAAICGLAMVAVSWAFSARAYEGTAKVQAIPSGSAQYTVDGTFWATLEKGAVLKQGATIRTDAMGVVDLYLGKNGPQVRLAPQTTLALSTLTYDEGAGETIVTTELGLTTGKIQGVVRKMSAASRYEVKTPVGTCGIRGTKYEITSTGRVTVESGFVDVMYTPPGASAPVKFEVPAGYTFDPMLNNGQGGVIPTPGTIRDQLNQDLRDLQQFTSPEERVTVWIPAPTWMMPDRPVDTTGQTSDKPWVLPPMYNPTTPTTSTPPAGGNGGNGGNGDDDEGV